MPDTGTRTTSNANDFDVVCECGAVYHTSEKHIGSYVKCTREGCGRRVTIRRNRRATLERSSVTPPAETRPFYSSNRDTPSSAGSSPLMRPLQVICAVCLFFALALLFSKLVLMAAARSSLHLPRRRFLYENLNAGILISIGFAVASGVLLLAARYKSVIASRETRLLHLGKLVLSRGMTVLRLMPLQWRVISTVTLAGVLTIFLVLTIRHTPAIPTSTSTVTPVVDEAGAKPTPTSNVVAPQKQPGETSPSGEAYWSPAVAAPQKPSKDIFDEVAPSPPKTQGSVPARHDASGNKQRRSPRPEKDVGVDLVIPNRTRIPLMDAPSATAKPLLIIDATETVALIDREPRNGWFNVIHVRSGKEGWVNVADVQVSYTQHPLPPPKFSEEYVGNDEDPTITVLNKTGLALTLKVGNAEHDVPAGARSPISLPAGAWKFHASAPGVIPLSGTKEWKRGYRYEWTFWIETTSVPILGFTRRP